MITPEHDYYPLTPSAEKKVPNFMQKWIPPREPPDRNVVYILTLNTRLLLLIPAMYINPCHFRLLVPDVSDTQVLTVGALHQVDSASLRTAALTWHDEFVALPKPILVVTLGGPTRKYYVLNTSEFCVVYTSFYSIL